MSFAPGRMRMQLGFVATSVGSRLIQFVIILLSPKHPVNSAEVQLSAKAFVAGQAFLAGEALFPQMQTHTNVAIRYWPPTVFFFLYVYPLPNHPPPHLLPR